MKHEDIDRLKEICEKEGFEVVWNQDSPFDSDTISIVKKDPWDGVEFVECVDCHATNHYTIGKIYKLVEKIDPVRNRLVFISNLGVKTNIFDYTEKFKGFLNNIFKPSTEAAYVDQLKKEAFERYGEIKDGDKFQFYGKGFHSIKLSDNPDLDYFKEFDELSLWGFPLYKQGKWAKKQDKRVEVAFDYSAKDLDGYSYKFTIENFKSLNHKDIGEHLASQLEKYLNNEINK